MKTTSKRAAALLAVALAALCGCGQEKPTGGQQDGGLAAGTLRLLEPGDTQGRYCVAAGPSSLVLCWMDYDSVQETPVCNAPNCQHSSEDCTACVMNSSVSGVAEVGELLVFVESSRPSAPSRLMACRRDGSERYKIAEMKSGDEIQGAPYCADEGYLYFHLLKMGGETGAGPCAADRGRGGGAADLQK